jgi:hypothetical protein
MYSLVDTVTNEVITFDVELSPAEVAILNYAYAMNTKSRLKYVLQETFIDSVEPLELFEFVQPL